jgi:integrase
MVRAMAKNKKTQERNRCRVVLTTHPSAPWRVSYPTEIDGKTVRRRRMFACEERAREWAEEHDRETANHGARFGSITAEARRAFDFFRDARAELREEGVDVPSFESVVMAAVARIRREHEERRRDRMAVCEAVEAFLSFKESRVGTQRRKVMKSELRRFSAAFGDRPLESITAGEVEAWLVTLRSRRGEPKILDATTRNGLRKTVGGLFAHAAAKPQGWCLNNPLEGMKKEKEHNGEPEAYTPQETRRIMETALELFPADVPWLALQFFAGLRPGETEIVDLENIDLASDEFRLPGGRKTGARLVPLLPACKAWLAAQPRRSGTASDPERGSQHRSNVTRAVLAACGIRLIKDGARHTFITHRCAEIRDVGRIADECGTSANIIKKHYRSIVSHAVAAVYFAIRPPQPAGNVLPMAAER